MGDKYHLVQTQRNQKPKPLKWYKLDWASSSEKQWKAVSNRRKINLD